MVSDQAAPPIGRRDIIKKSAVVAAAGWAAPTILSSRASATNGGTCQHIDCETMYLVKIDANNGPCEDNLQLGIPNWLKGDCKENYEDLLGSEAVATVQGGGCGSPLRSFSTTGDTYLEFTLEPNHQLVFVLNKKGETCARWGPSSVTCDEDGRHRYTFTGSFSNAVIVFCSGFQEVSYNEMSAYSAIVDSGESTEEIGGTGLLEEPAEPTEEPTEEPAEPTEEPAEEPAEPTEEPAEPTEEPADPVEEPGEDSTDGTEDPIEDPTDETIAPTELTEDSLPPED